MAKFVYAVLTVFLIELGLWLFGGTTYGNSTLFGILTDPSTLISNPLYATVIVLTLAAFAGSAIIPGNLWSINIYALYAGVMVIFVTFAISIVHLWTFVSGSLSGLAYPFNTLIASLIVSPILIMYLIAGLEWVRSNQ